MQLSDLRTEVLSHGFDPVQFGSSRVNTYLNDGYMDIVSRTNYYVDEAAYDFSTVTGTAIYPYPADFGRIRSLRDTNRAVEMQPVFLRQIDRSPLRSGAPTSYAQDAANFHLYPTPDSAAYPMEARYWKIPTVLANDTDVPTIPARWHKLLWYYAVAEAYEAEDDAQNGQTWTQKYETNLMRFMADVKLPDTDLPLQVSGMWDGDQSLAARTGWTVW